MPLSEDPFLLPNIPETRNLTEYFMFVDVKHVFHRSAPKLS